MTAFQIKLRAREIGLLEVMSERDRRRPQEQAAWLVARALEDWAAVQDFALDDAVDPREQEVEAWVEETP